MKTPTLPSRDSNNGPPDSIPTLTIECVSCGYVYVDYPIEDDSYCPICASTDINVIGEGV